MITNEQLAERVQSGDPCVLELWERVRRFAYGRAIRWVAAVGVQSGVDLDDLLQSAFLALLDALDRWEPSGECKFITFYSTALKAAFSAACCVHTKRERMDPLRYAIPLDVPVLDGGEEGSTLAELIPDQRADTAFEDVVERERLRAALERALDQIPKNQAEAIRAVYFRGERADNRLRNAALRSLRKPAISRALKQFL